MDITSDPTCNYSEERLETAAHFLCECSHFVTLCQEIWGKSYLHPSEADSVQNLVRFILKSHRFLYTLSLDNRSPSGDGLLTHSAYGLYEPCLLLEWNGR